MKHWNPRLHSLSPTLIITSTSHSDNHIPHWNTHTRTYSQEVCTVDEDRKANMFLNRDMGKRDTAKTTHHSGRIKSWMQTEDHCWVNPSCPTPDVLHHLATPVGSVLWWRQRQGRAPSRSFMPSAVIGACAVSSGHLCQGTLPGFDPWVQLQWQQITGFDFSHFLT